MTTEARPPGILADTIESLQIVRGGVSTVIWPLSTMGLLYPNLLPWTVTTGDHLGIAAGHVLWSAAFFATLLVFAIIPSSVERFLPQAGSANWWIATAGLGLMFLGMLYTGYRILMSQTPVTQLATREKEAAAHQAALAYAESLFSSRATAETIVTQEERAVGTTTQTACTAAAFFWGWLLLAPVWIVSICIGHHSRSVAEKAGAWYGVAASVTFFSFLVLATDLLDMAPLGLTLIGLVLAAGTRYYQATRTLTARIKSHTQLSTLGAPPNSVTLGRRTGAAAAAAAAASTSARGRSDSARLMFESSAAARASSVSPSLTPTPAVPSSTSASASAATSLPSSSSPSSQNMDADLEAALAASAEASAAAAAAALLAQPEPEASSSPSSPAPTSSSSPTSPSKPSKPSSSSSSSSQHAAAPSSTPPPTSLVAEGLPAPTMTSPSSSSASRTSSADSGGPGDAELPAEQSRIPLAADVNPLTAGAGAVSATGKAAAPQHMVYVGPERAAAYNPAAPPTSYSSGGGAMSLPPAPNMAMTEPVPPGPMGGAGGFTAPAAPPPPPAPPTQPVNSGVEA